MATWASLSPAQQLQIQSFVDQSFRPAVLTLARAYARASVVVLPQYLDSPTGLSSTMGSPAADSVAGLLATLTAGEVIPILSSGLPLAGPLLASKVVSYCTTLNTRLGTDFSNAAQQDYAQIVGSINLIA